MKLRIDASVRFRDIFKLDPLRSGYAGVSLPVLARRDILRPGNRKPTNERQAGRQAQIIPTAISRLVHTATGA